MLSRAPEYFFTPEDVELITKETGIDENMIQHWGRSLRWRMDTNLLGTSIKEYLQASAESLAEKVFCHDVLASHGKLPKKVWDFSDVLIFLSIYRRRRSRPSAAM